MKKKVLAFTMAVLMLGTLALTGCQKEEAPIAADKVAVALFEMILKNDASSAVELFGYASEEDARKDMGLDGDLFENAITAMKNDRAVSSDTDLSAADLEELVGVFKGIFSDNVSAEEYPALVIDGAVQFPQDPMMQLQLAIEAVFGSWNNPRAVLYRQKEKIADDLGTAVNVQSMVFGNKGETSATGVAFTRNPANGTKEFYGDYLVNAQGEDVVAGIRNTSPIAELKEVEGLEEAGDEEE